MVDVGPADDDASDPTNVSAQIVQIPALPVTLPITALITPTKFPVTSVVLKYRIMYEPDVPVPMVDDGTNGDAAAGDGIYTGLISTTKLLPGQMLRWKVEATDSQGVVGKEPPFKEPTDSPEYFGTVAIDRSLETSLLPILHWFMAPTANPDTDSRVGVALYYNGEFYDNVGTTIHGQSTRDGRFLKKSYDLNFTGGHHFKYGPEETRASDINLLTDFPDKTKARNTLAYEVLRLSGVRAHFAFPARMQRNGQLYGLVDIVENGDASYLERAGFDPQGALYKLYSFLTPSSTFEKKTRRNENAADLTAFATGMAKTGEAFLQFGYDNVDVAANINFLAALIMTHNDDLGHKNYYCYRDTNGTREWTLLPWDMDLAFGHNWTGSANYFDDSMYTDRAVSPGPGAGNRFFDFGYTGSAALTEMFRRRLRTLRDRFLPQTGNDTWHHNRFNEILAQIDPPNVVSDADLDYAKWGPAPWVLANGSTVSPNKANTPAQEIARVLNEYIPGRRTRLYTTNASIFPPAQVAHPVINIGAIEPNPGLPNSQTQEFFVLENPNTTAVDLSGWTITGGVEMTLPPGTVIPSITRATVTDPDRNKLYVARNALGFRARTTSPKALEKRFVVSGYRGQLSARGESIELRDDTGFVIATKSWPAAPTPAQLSLRITEIHFSPPPPTAAELAALPGVSGSDFEYIELENIGAAALDLGGITVTEGLDFVFPAGIMLEPGGRILVVANTAAFDLRYGTGLNRVGNWDGRLSNGGDRLQLVDMVGESIIDFTYNDTWYPWVEAHGHSLVVVDPAATPHDEWGKRTRWGVSLEPAGTPGKAAAGFAMVYEVWENTAFTADEREHPEAVGLEIDFDRDDLINLLEYATSSNPKDGASRRLPTASVVTVGGERYAALTFRSPKNALDLTYTLETSHDLGPWSAGAKRVGAATDNGDGTETVTLRSRLPEPTPHTSTFLRLRVTHTP
jgi:CotH kinase protein/Lamin Tail Domain